MEYLSPIVLDIDVSIVFDKHFSAAVRRNSSAHISFRVLFRGLPVFTIFYIVVQWRRKCFYFLECHFQ